MDKWLLDNIVKIGLIILASVGGGIMAFLKMRAMTEALGKKVNEDGLELDRHLASELPHTSCRVERERLLSISDRLARIEDKIETVDSRVVQILRGTSARGNG